MDHPLVCIYTIKYDLKEKKKIISHQQRNITIVCLFRMDVWQKQLVCPIMTCILQIPVLKWWKGIFSHIWWFAKYSFPFLTKYRLECKVVRHATSSVFQCATTPDRLLTAAGPLPLCLPLKEQGKADIVISLWTLFLKQVPWNWAVLTKSERQTVTKTCHKISIVKLLSWMNYSRT